MSPIALFTRALITATVFAPVAFAHSLVIDASTSLLVPSPYASTLRPITTSIYRQDQALPLIEQPSGPVTVPCAMASFSPAVATGAAPPAPDGSAPSSSPLPSPLPLQNRVDSATTTSVSVSSSTQATQTEIYNLPQATGPSNSGDSGSSVNSATTSSDGDCEGESQVCSGDITHWDGGLGACGWDVDTNQGMQIALPVGLMGSSSNGNLYCGRQVTIRNPNTQMTALATVGDKCMGCIGRAIDLTDALFNTIGGGCVGRCSGFEWWFN